MQDVAASSSVIIFHNVLWSSYKGTVFSELWKKRDDFALNLQFFQIAETEGQRRSLSPIDLSHHTYPYELLFEGAYEDAPILSRISKLCKIVWRSSVPLVLLPGYHEPEYWAMLAAAKMTGKKAAVFCDSTKFDSRKSSWFREALKRLFVRHCDGFFAYGARSREYLMSMGAASEEIFPRCQAAALPKGYSERNVMESRMKVRLTPYSPQLLYVGRLAPEKNLECLLHAFAKLVPQHEGMTLRMVGTGPSHNELSGLVQLLGISHRVEFAGALSGQALADAYLEATVFILPSLSEPWGLVVNEALSYGCPVIVSNHCGCVPELVQDGRTGFQFNPNSAGELQSAVESFLNCGRTESEWASDCLSVIANYTPNHAAIQIARGCKALLSRVEA